MQQTMFFAAQGAGLLDGIRKIVCVCYFPWVRNWTRSVQHPYGNDPTMQIRAREVIEKVPLELQVPPQAPP